MCNRKYGHLCEKNIVVRAYLGGQKGLEQFHNPIVGIRVGGVAQWLGRRSLVGGLFMICARSTVWLTANHVEAKIPLLVSQTGQLSLPSLRGRQMSINPGIYMEYRGGYHRNVVRVYGCRSKSVNGSLGFG